MSHLLGRYELLGRLARGGMADVYLARRRAAAGIEKRLVVKRIRREHAADAHFVRLFVKEARLSVDLTHANIVPVFDFGRVGDDLFLAMEHVAGRDLAAVIRRAAAEGEALDPVLVAHVGAEACLALDYAHRRRDAAGQPLGLVHRDVTPRNVLVSFAGEVKLVDFGVASLAGEEHGRVRGTPAYMSPEQARGEPVDGRSDLYSLGVVLAEALGGERRSGGAALAQARAGVPPAIPAGAPAELRAAIERATHADPAARFADARAMHQALDRTVVAARAADPARGAPSHELGLLLGRLFADDPEVPLEEPDAAAGGGGPALTFLDDGEGAVSLIGDGAGDATLRSIAETAGEDEPLAEAPPPPPVARRRWVGALAMAGVALAAVAAIALRGTGGAREAREGSPVDAAAQVATAPVSAPPDAAATAPPPPVSLDVAAAAPPAPRPAKVAARPRLYPVEINSRPWARVYIDERYVDDTPFHAQLPAGSHHLRFENPVDRTSKSVTIEVPRSLPVIVELSP